MVGIVYKASNIVTNEVYIGATTRSVEERQTDHIQKANNGLGSYFQQAIGTYGPEAFSWEQIDTAQNLNELAQKESYYILEYNSKDKGYNEDRGGGFKKTIYQYNLDGEFIKSFEDLSSAASAVTATKKQMSKVCLSKSNLLKNSYWSYKYIEPFVPETDLRKKAVYQCDIENNILSKYESVSEASKKSNVSKSSIAKCCRGERLTGGGYKWNYTSTNDISNNV